MSERIDISSWNRKEIYEFFSRLSMPFYMVSFRQDVTKLREYTKANGLSFYYSLTYLVTKAMNNIDAFNYVIRDGEVWHIDGRMPSFTDMKKGSETFHIVTMPCEGSIAEFSKAARKKSSEQEEFIDSTKESDELIYISCLPWVDLTGLTNERDLDGSHAKDESIPHITWGKYIQNGDRYELGISIETNHRLIDGVHIGKFAEELTHLIESL